MKAKRRQELKTNELAEMLTQLRQWHDKNSTLVWGVVLGIVVVLLVSTLWYRSAVSRRTENWNRFFTLRQQLVGALQGQEGDPGPAVRELTDMASSAGDAQVRNSASLAVGIYEWRRANGEGAAAGPAGAVAPDAAESAAALKEASGSFQRIIDARKASNVNRLIAKLGEAAVRENNGDIKGATALYTEVADAKTAAHTGLDAIAKDSLERLKQPMVTGPFPPKPATPTAAVPPQATTQPALPGDESPATAPAKISTFTPTTQPAGDGE